MVDRSVNGFEGPINATLAKKRGVHAATASSCQGGKQVCICQQLHSRECIEADPDFCIKHFMHKHQFSSRQAQVTQFAGSESHEALCDWTPQGQKKSITPEISCTKFSQKRCQGAKLCSCVLLFDCSLSHTCSKGSSSVIDVFMLCMSFHIFVKQGSDMHMHTYLEFVLHRRDCKSGPNVLPLQDC